MSEDATLSPPPPKLGLRVTTARGQHYRSIREDTTIGNDDSCDILVDMPDRWHAIVRDDDEGRTLLRTCGDYDIHNSDDCPTRSLALEPGVRFRIGDTQFECVDLDDTALEQASSTQPPVVRRACPRCRKSLCRSDFDARYCAHCGIVLPDNCPDWPELPPIRAALRVHAWWARWIPQRLWRRIPNDPLFFARRPTVLAYINSLFNLGLHCEVGDRAEANLPEALRYYRKAARLGHLPARVRMHVKQAERHR